MLRCSKTQTDFLSFCATQHILMFNGKKTSAEGAGPSGGCDKTG
jgi:hypothetical protein